MSDQASIGKTDENEPLTTDELDNVSGGNAGMIHPDADFMTPGKPGFMTPGKPGFMTPGHPGAIPEPPAQ